MMSGWRTMLSFVRTMWPDIKHKKYQTVTGPLDVATTQIRLYSKQLLYRKCHTELLVEEFSVVKSMYGIKGKSLRLVVLYALENQLLGSDGPTTLSNLLISLGEQPYAVRCFDIGKRPTNPSMKKTNKTKQNNNNNKNRAKQPKQITPQKP